MCLIPCIIVWKPWMLIISIIAIIWIPADKRKRSNMFHKWLSTGHTKIKLIHLIKKKHFTSTLCHSMCDKNQAFKQLPWMPYQMCDPVAVSSLTVNNCQYEMSGWLRHCIGDPGYLVRSAQKAFYFIFLRHNIFPLFDHLDSMVESCHIVFKYSCLFRIGMTRRCTLLCTRRRLLFFFKCQ